jgi:hypothetical protein
METCFCEPDHLLKASFFCRSCDVPIACPDHHICKKPTVVKTVVN